MDGRRLMGRERRMMGRERRMVMEGGCKGRWRGDRPLFRQKANRFWVS